MKGIFILIKILLISHILSHSSQNSFSCHDSIFDSDGLLSQYTKNQLCNKVIYDNYRIILRLTSNLQAYQNQNIKGDELLYDKDSEHFLDSIVLKNHYNGDNCMLITVYHSARKIRITTGNNLSNKITHSVTDSIIDKMTEHLRRDDFNSAFTVAVDDSISSFTSSSFAFVTDYAESFFTYTILFIVIIVILAVVIGMCVQTKDQIIETHLTRLRDLLKTSIQQKNPPVTSITQCTLCMEVLSEPIVKFSCNHIYHFNCVNSKVRKDNKIDSYCVMCDEPTAQVSNDFNVFSQVVHEGNVINVINNFDKLYERDELRSYYNKKQDDVKYTREYCSSNCWMFDSYITRPYSPTRNSSNSASGAKYSTSGRSYSSSSKSTSRGSY